GRPGQPHRAITPASTPSSPRLENAEALGFDAEGDVELRAEVLEGHGGGQLDHLRLAEVGAHPGEQLVAHAPIAEGHRLGELEGRPLALAEKLARRGRPQLRGHWP